MRIVIVASVAAFTIAGCASPREKDCKELLPRVDAAHAKPTAESVASLRAFVVHDEALREPTTKYAAAVDRQVASAKAFGDLVAAMKMKKTDGPAPTPAMFEPSRPHAERLLERCLFAKPLPPDCAALGQALESCLTPAADDTTAEEQLLTCASRFGAVKSEDAATNESIQALAAAMRDLEPFARNVGAPAKDVIRVAKAVAPAFNDAKKARADANAAEMEIRSLCQPGSGASRGGTRGPS